MSGRALIVDDSGLARRIVRQILEQRDVAVIEAEDGMSALEQYTLERPDVVILDLVMRGMYGQDVLVKLRALDPNARVIVVTADIQTPARESAQAAGALAFINKPVNAAELLDAVDAALGSPR
jgi:two-component system, chemotaxis family, chemotaxis protein CheY